MAPTLTVLVADGAAGVSMLLTLQGAGQDTPLTVTATPAAAAERPAEESAESVLPSRLLSCAGEDAEMVETDACRLPAAMVVVVTTAV